MDYRTLATGESISCLPLGSISRPGLFNNMNSIFLTNNSLGASHVPDLKKDLGMQGSIIPEEALFLSLVPVVWEPGEERYVVIKYSVLSVKLHTKTCDTKEKFHSENGRPEEAQPAHSSGIFGSGEGRSYV